MTKVKESYEEELTTVLSAMLGCEADEVIDVYKRQTQDTREMVAYKLLGYLAPLVHY